MPILHGSTVTRSVISFGCITFWQEREDSNPESRFWRPLASPSATLLHFYILIQTLVGAGRLELPFSI